MFWGILGAMRYLFAVLIALAACSPSESLPTACSPACAAGQVCVNAQCLAPVDGGSDVRDVAAVDAPAADAPADVVAQESGTPDAAVDATIDGGPVADAQAVDVAPEAAADVAPDALVCPMGFADCDGMAANGCETDTRANFNHCGGCGMRCLIAGDGTPTCTLGSCGVACGVGQGNCDGMLANGCETRLDTSAHCGSCAVSCGVRSCTMGICR